MSRSNRGRSRTDSEDSHGGFSRGLRGARTPRERGLSRTDSENSHGGFKHGLRGARMRNVGDAGGNGSSPLAVDTSDWSRTPSPGRSPRAYSPFHSETLDEKIDQLKKYARVILNATASLAEIFEVRKVLLKKNHTSDEDAQVIYNYLETKSNIHSQPFWHALTAEEKLEISRHFQLRVISDPLQMEAIMYNSKATASVYVVLKGGAALQAKDRKSRTISVDAEPGDTFGNIFMQPLMGAMARKNLAEYKEAETKRWRALASLSQAQAAKKKRSASKDSIDDRSVASGAEQGGAAEGEGKDGGDGDAGDGTGNDTTGNSDSKNNGEDGENASPSKEEYPHHAHVAKSKKELLFARCGECDKIKLHFQLKSELIFLAQENAQYMLDRINGRLEKQEFFEHIGLPFVAPLAVERDFASGAVLAREDTSAKEIMFIFEGECSQEKKIVNNRVEKIKKRQREPTFSADSHDMGDDGLADNDEPHEPHKNKSGEHAFDYTSGGKGRLRKKTKVQAPPNSEILLPSGFKFAIKKCQLSLLGPQAIIGDISAVMNAPHPTTVQAMCDVRVFSVPIRAFKESLLPYPGIRQALRVSAKTKAKRIDHVVRSFVKGQGPRRDDDARRRGRGFKPLLEPESPTSLVLNPDANKAEQGLEPAPSEPKPRPKRMAKAKSRLDRRKSYLEVEEERPKTVVPVVVERVTTGKLRVAADVYEIRNRAYVQRGLEVKSNLQPPGKSQRGAKAEAAAKDAEDAEDAEDTEDAEDAEDEEDAEGLETPQRKAWAELELIAQSVRRGSLLDGKLQDLGSRPAVMSQTAPAALKGDANPPTTKPTEPTPDADDDVTALSGTQSTPHRANFVIDVPTPHGDFKGSAGSNSGFDIGDSITSAGEAPPPIIENDLEELASLQAGEAAEQQLAPEALGEAARWKAVPAAAAEAPSASAPPGAQPLTAGAEEAGEEASTSGEPPDKLEKSKSTITFAKRFLKDAYGRITGQDLLHAGELGAGKRSLILDIMINNAGLLVEGPQYSGLGDGRSKLGGDFEAKEAQKALEELVQEMVMRRRKNLEVEPVPTITCDRRLHGRSLPTVRHSDGYENPWLQ